MDTQIHTAGILIIENERVLLVRHTKNATHQTDLYGLPAGKIQPNETPIEAAIRELHEETGLTAIKPNLTQIHPVYTAKIRQKNSTKQYTFTVFICHKYTGVPRASHETTPEWIHISQIDEKNLLPNVAHIIQNAYKNYT